MTAPLDVYDRFGRRHAPDRRDIPAARLVELDRPAKAVAVPRTSFYYWERFNQDQTGPTCVANSVYHLMGDAPAPTRSMLGMEGAGPGSQITHPVTGAKMSASGYVSHTSGQAGWRGLVYDLAQQVDEFTDTPPGAGTSARAACKVLQASGLITAYAWLATAAEVVQAVLNHGPVALGCNWYEQMMFRADGRSVQNGDHITAKGASLGGHEVVLSGVNTNTGLFRVQTWGIHLWLPIADVDVLLANGDAVLVTEL